MSLIVIPGCAYLIEEAGGDRVQLDVEIQFRNSDGTAATHKPVYIIERIGSSLVATEILKTDIEGRLWITGNRCLSMIVAVDGGSVVVERPTLRKFYLVMLQSDHQPSAESLAGQPDPKYSHYADKHHECG